MVDAMLSGMLIVFYPFRHHKIFRYICVLVRYDCGANIAKDLSQDMK